MFGTYQSLECVSGAPLSFNIPVMVNGSQNESVEVSRLLQVLH